jgi:hypothetical protein
MTSAEQAVRRTAEDRAVDALRALQCEDGEFASVVSTRPDMKGVRAPDTNHFTTPQVIWSLGFVRHRRVPSMRRRAGAFLLQGREPDGTWRFFSPKVKRRIDPDNDATGCCAAALRALGSLSGDALTRDALLGHRDAQGRLLTWLRPAGPNDVDSVANANALWFLGDDPDARDAARWLVSLVVDGGEAGTFPYYETPLALYHALARARFAGAHALAAADEAVVRRVRAHQRADGAFGNALETAFAVVALVNLGERESSRAGARWLRRAQRRDGTWADCAAWNGPELPAPRSVWWGGAAWTTALALEAIVRAG